MPFRVLECAFRFVPEKNFALHFKGEFIDCIFHVYTYRIHYYYYFHIRFIRLSVRIRHHIILFAVLNSIARHMDTYFYLLNRIKYQF